MKTRIFTITSLLAFSPFTLASSQVTDAIAPESTTAVVNKKIVTAKRYMVAAANPHAVQAGYDVLKKAVLPPMHWLRCKPCSDWLSHSHPGWVAGLFWSITMPENRN